MTKSFLSGFAGGAAFWLLVSLPWWILLIVIWLYFGYRVYKNPDYPSDGACFVFGPIAYMINFACDLFGKVKIQNPIVIKKEK